MGIECGELCVRFKVMVLNPKLTVKVALEEPSHTIFKLVQNELSLDNVWKVGQVHQVRPVETAFVWV